MDNFKIGAWFIASLVVCWVGFVVWFIIQILDILRDAFA